MKEKKDFKIMFVDDEKVLLTNIKRDFLEYSIKTFDNSINALEELKSNQYDILIVDQKMPNLTGLELLKEAKKNSCYKIGILLSAFVDKKLLESMINQDLVKHVLDKPINNENLKAVLDRSIKTINENEAEADRINKEIQYYKDIVLSHLNTMGDINIISQDDGMKELIKLMESYADSKANILITGESGTGKELFAQWIHYKSKRKNKPFVKINCSAIPDSLFESELFGHEKGAFTGAYKNKAGKFEIADEGTLFLDEIGDLPISQQAKLLRILEDNELVRVGGSEPVKIDVRVICATNKDLEKMIKVEKFREDLYFRLNVLKIRIPALRERNGDILLLSAYYLNKISNEEGGPEKYLSEEASKYLKDLKFPGNIRELKNFIHRLYLSSKNNVISYHEVITLYNQEKELINNYELFDKAIPLNEFKNQAESSYLRRQLEINKYNVVKTAKLLGLTTSNLHRKLDLLNIPKSLIEK